AGAAQRNSIAPAAAREGTDMTAPSGRRAGSDARFAARTLRDSRSHATVGKNSSCPARAPTASTARAGRPRSRHSKRDYDHEGWIDVVAPVARVTRARAYNAIGSRMLRPIDCRVRLG